MSVVQYINLEKLYYKDENFYEKEYMKRFDAPFTKHFNFSIKQFNRKHSYPIFLCYTEDIVKILIKIYKHNCNLNEIVEKIPSIAYQQFIRQCLILEVQSTNAIEGIRSTRKEIELAMENNLSSKEKIRLQGIVSKYMKLLHNEDIHFNSPKDLRSFYDDFALSEVLLENPQNKPDGIYFRKGSVEISTGTQKTIHRGLTPESEIISSITTALEILNDESIPELIRLAIFHYLFGYIHPFYDGNGRTARFISSYYLSKELNRAIALRLSIIIKKDINNYYKMFDETNSELNKGDLTPFVYSFLLFIARSAENAEKLLSNKLTQLGNFTKQLTEMDLGDGIKKQIYYILLQAALFSGSGATIKDIETTLKKSRVTIQNRIDEIPASHIIINKSKKPYTYKLNTIILK